MELLNHRILAFSFMMLASTKIAGMPENPIELKKDQNVVMLVLTNATKSIRVEIRNDGVVSIAHQNPQTNRVIKSSFVKMKDFPIENFDSLGRVPLESQQAGSWSMATITDLSCAATSEILSVESEKKFKRIITLSSKLAAKEYTELAELVVNDK